MGDESSQGSDEHNDFTESDFFVFGKDKSNFVALFEDSNDRNRVFARLFGRVFLGCHSHCFAWVV